MGIHESGTQTIAASTDSSSDTRQAAATQIGKELRAQHTELLSGLTKAERQGLAIGLAGIARVLRKHNRQPGMVTDTTNTHNTNNKDE